MSVKLAKAPNFRDMGGLPTADGRRLRPGVVYRSEALVKLDEDDLQALHGLGINAVYDLRSRSERERDPNRLPTAWQGETLIADEGEHGGGADLVRQFLHSNHQDASRVRDFMLQTYRGFPAIFAAAVATLFEYLAAARGSILIHCAAGKDRTGFVCAMLQHALGVSPEQIELDYLASNEYFGADRILRLIVSRTGHTPPADVVDAVRVQSEYLQASREQIQADYGGVDDYLLQQTGLTAQRRDALQAALLRQA